jgi:hypothetical protein
MTLPVVLPAVCLSRSLTVGVRASEDLPQGHGGIVVVLGFLVTMEVGV